MIMKIKIKRLTKYQYKYLLILSIYGASPSGKAAGFDPVTRRFESFRPRFIIFNNEINKKREKV